MNRRGTALITAAAACLALAAGSAAAAANAATTEVSSTAQPAASSGHWTAAVPVPGLAALNVGKNAALNDISCPRAGDCILGGAPRPARMPSASSTAPPGARRGRCPAWPRSAEKNGTWVKNRLLPDYDEGTTLTAVSCRSAGNCLATGNISLGMEDDYSLGNESFGIAEINGTWGPIKFLTVAGNDETDSAVQSYDRNGDCAIGGTIQYTASGVEEAAGFSAYVASYTP